MEPLPAPTRRTRTAQYRRRTRLVWLLAGIGLAMVAVYSIAFHVLMAAEGQSHSWATGIYWTISTMGTLGYGDITFTSDTGRLFSVWVLVSGAVLIALLLPFALIQFVITPWLDQREAARAPRRAPTDLSGHLIITGSGAVVQALLARTRRAGVPALLVVPSSEDAAPLLDAGHHVVVGALDAVSTYRAAGVHRAKMVISTLPDASSANTVLSVRAVDADVPIAVVAETSDSVEVLTAAGADYVVPLATRLGEALAQRVLGTTGRAHVIGDLGAALVAEATVVGTDLAGLSPAQVRDALPEGVQVLTALTGRQVQDETATLSPEAVLVLAGPAAALAEYDARYAHPTDIEAPVVILGGGRVGRAAAAALAAETSVTVVEQNPDRPRPRAEVVYGDAAQAEVLQQAGLAQASAVLVTTHDDDLNVYLTLYCRRLRPGVQVVARAMSERNLATLHRAGADSVLSYATIGAGALWNELGVGRRVVIAEGIELFATPVPAALSGAPVDGGQVHQRTGAQVVAVLDDDGVLAGVDVPLPQGSGHQLLLLGDRHAEERFRRHYLRHRR